VLHRWNAAVMTLLIIGLIVFIGTHSVRIVADDWRNRQIAGIGENRWKLLVSVVSLAGFVLMVWGYGQTRAGPDLWAAPVWMRHVTALLTIPAFVLVVAAYVPRNHLKAAIGHPMVAGVKLWAFAHLIANTRPADIALFGTFLVWAVIAFIASRRRDRRTRARYPPGELTRDVVAVAIGLAAWAAFAFYGHEWLIGVRPFR
jgi:uncharacterized membrane protein